MDTVNKFIDLPPFGLYDIYQLYTCNKGVFDEKLP